MSHETKTCQMWSKVLSSQSSSPSQFSQLAFYSIQPPSIRSSDLPLSFSVSVKYSQSSSPSQCPQVAFHSIQPLSLRSSDFRFVLSWHSYFVHSGHMSESKQTFLDEWNEVFFPNVDKKSLVVNININFQIAFHIIFMVKAEKKINIHNHSCNFL